MLALTLWPEWAWCIRPEDGWKHVENRTWAPWKILPGGSRLAIHAGARVGGQRTNLWEQEFVLEELLEAFEDFGLLVNARAVRVEGDWHIVTPSRTERIATRSIVAVATLEDWDTKRRSRWDDPHSVHWRLTDIQRLEEPVPCGGRQGLWPLPPEVEHKVVEQRTRQMLGLAPGRVQGSSDV